ncbi:MAG: hypothetical protein P4L57_09845 [Rhizomicrobium sp.]|nr:hypothetical protein [Rhizomicrobium sp.]
MKIALIIASRGRPALLASVLGHWAAQSRPLDQRIISLSSSEDAGDLAVGLVDNTVIGPAGLCMQRNRALDALTPTGADLVIFADDDYIPSRDFVREVEVLFGGNSDIVVATGNVLADGVTSGGIAYTDAIKCVSDYDAKWAGKNSEISDTTGAYGCNMVIRWSADCTIRCDERLPLYGWQEDIDYSRQYREYGRIVHTDAFAGVHMGSQGARSPGKRLGYSQVINPVYLILKGTMPARFGLRLLVRNILSNIRGAVLGDAHIDRFGRLNGNLLALRHLLLGRVRPEHVLSL